MNDANASEYKWTGEQIKSISEWMVYAYGAMCAFECRRYADVDRDIVRNQIQRCRASMPTVARYLFVEAMKA